MNTIELLIPAFLAVMLVAAFISHKTRFPYTVVLVFVGIAVTSTSLYALFGPFASTAEFLVTDMRSTFDALVQGSGGGLFVGLIIPPLLFDAMIHVNSTDLKQVIRPSLTLATVGVVVATLVGGLVLWKVVDLPFYVSFLFAALISPTDTATVLALFRKVNVPSKLATMMDTEAALNDATAIVIFSVIITSISLPTLSLVGAAETFALTFGGGVAVGLLVAFLGEVLMSTISDRLVEVLLTIFAVYGSYTIAFAFGFSGLIAVAVVGLYFGSLTTRSAMGPATRESVALFWEVAAFIGNSVAFLFIGFEASILKLVSGIELIGAAFLAVIVARAASVYPILSLFDRLRAKTPRTWKNVAMLGGMRGAISVALALSIPVSAAISSSDIETITTMVLGVAFISITVQGALLSHYVGVHFSEGHAERLDVRLSRVTAAIENLQKMKDEGKIGEDAFVAELEKDKDELREVLNEAHATVDASGIVRSRTKDLYSSIVGLPMSKAMGVLKHNKMNEPIEQMVEKAKDAEEERREESGRKGKDEGS